MSQLPTGSRPPQGPQTPATPQPRPGAPVATPAAVSAAVLDPVRLLRMYWHWLAVAVLIGAVVGLAAYFVLERVAPQYRASVVFQVVPPYNPEQPALQGEAGNRDETVRFIATEAARFRQQGILRLVVENPDFQQLAWARQFQGPGGFETLQALTRLETIVSSSPIPDTNFFRMSVTAPTATDSAEIARLLSAAYLADREQLQRTGIRAEQGSLRNLRDTLQEQLIASARRIETLLRDGNLIALRETDTEYALEIRQLQSQIGTARQQISLLSDQLKSYQDSVRDSGGTVFPPAIVAEAENDRIVQQLKSEIVALETDLASARERLGPNHQTVVLLESRIRTRITRRDQIIEERTKSIFENAVSGLGDQISALEASVADAVERLDTATTAQESITQIIKQVEEATRERDQIQTRLAALESQGDSIELLNRRGIRVQVAEAARLPDSRAFPQLRIFLPLGVILFGGLTAGLIVLKELREQRIRTPQDIALIPRTRLLGVVPDLSLDPLGADSFDKACLLRPDGTIAETMRQVRATLLKRLEAAGQKSLLLVSAAPESGASSVAANLAVSLARVDKRVLLIDANLRKPSLHKSFSIPDGPGLAELLRGQGATLDSAVRPTSEPNLFVLPAGTDRRGVFDRLNTADMRRIVAQAEAAYDLVLIDAPPAVVSTDAVALAQHAAATILVVRAFAETRGLLARLRNQFADVPAEFLGVILNAVPTSAGGYMKRNIQQTFEYSKGVIADQDTKRGATAA